jgi:hypothetical protein
LPRWDDATERQRRDGMCWKQPDERYNDGGAFKLTARDRSGVIVTMIADNYFGYCKKEVKTQISFAANLLGGNARSTPAARWCFPATTSARIFNSTPTSRSSTTPSTRSWRNWVTGSTPSPADGHATGGIRISVYVPEDARFDLRAQTISWARAGEGEQSLKLLPRQTYVLPSGYKIEMVKPDEGRRWRLRGTTAEGVLCHKPCTVSGGGKSEISKSIADATFIGPNFVGSLAEDFELVDRILQREFGQRFRDPARNRPKGRPLLSTERSLGSVVKLLSPSSDYTDEYNAWLATIPPYIHDLILLIKRYYKPEWGNDWRRHFSVDTINGRPGNEVKYHRQKVLTHYLRVGYTPDGGWRTFSLRKDFFPR